MAISLLNTMIHSCVDGVCRCTDNQMIRDDNCVDATTMHLTTFSEQTVAVPHPTTVLETQSSTTSVIMPTRTSGHLSVVL